MTEARSGSSAAHLCSVLGISRPVLSAPMAAIAGGRLAAAVSNAGGLGLIGGGYGERDWLTKQIGEAAGARIGIGLITFSITAGTVEWVLVHRPAAVWLSFGDPAPFVPIIHEAGAVVISQVGTVAEAEFAVEAGTDVIVAQGSEAGGHGWGRSSVASLVSDVSRAWPDLPLVAAGGISDRSGFDNAQRLGAAGVAVGSGFYATHEALDIPDAKQRLVDSGGDDTERGVVYDIIRGSEWPEPYDGRFIRTELSDQWTGREAELRRDPGPVVARHQQATDDGDMTRRVVWAGQGIDAITAIRPAAEVVARFPEVGQAKST